MLYASILGNQVIFHTNPSALPLRVCLDRAKNNIRIEELRIANEDSETIMIFQLAR
jgi:hypothetical protein